MLGTKVFLELYVKVQPNWRESRGFVEELDWRRQLERLTGGQLDLIQNATNVINKKS
jgi:GTP-binding protein Era